MPRVKSAAGVWKLNSKALFDRERLRELQTAYGETLAPLGIRRGEPGSMATHSEARQFYGAVQAAKGLPERVKLPRAPKAPEPPSDMAARAANAMGLALGIETAHQRAMKAHAEAMRQWREKVKDLHQQDAAAWEQMRACSVVSKLRQRHRAPAPFQRQTPSPMHNLGTPTRKPR